MRFSLSIFFAILNITSLFAQDAFFSQPYANPIYFNPALTGMESGKIISINYRNQWPGSAANYTTKMASFENSLANRNASYGFQFFNDEEGNNIINQEGFAFAYAYQVMINKEWSIRAGISGGLTQRSINYDQLIFEDQLNDGEVVANSRELFDENAVYFADFSSGFFIRNKIFYGGVGLSHLNTPNLSNNLERENELELKTTVHAGARIRGGIHHHSKQYISPNIIFQTQGKTEQLSLGSYFHHRTITLGTWYRLDRALVMAFGIEFNRLKIAYSFDMNTEMVNAGAGSHEISLRYQIPHKKKDKNTNLQLADCPTF